MLPEIRESRYREVCSHILENRRNKDIGNRMGIAEKTVKNYLNQIYRRLKLKNRRQLRELMQKQLFKNATIGEMNERKREYFKDL